MVGHAAATPAEGRIPASAGASLKA